MSSPVRWLRVRGTRQAFSVRSTVSGGPDSTRSVRLAGYTAAQATRGEAVFRGTCGNCHSASQFIGPSFDVVWADRPVFDFFDQLRSTMPLDNPGGLSREEYAGVIAYILKLNDHPAGDDPLPHEDAPLKLVKFPPQRP